MKKIRIIFCQLLVCFGIVSNAYSITIEPHLDDSKQEQYSRDIFKNVRCLVCQGESINDSRADLARDLRIFIREKVSEGRSRDEIFHMLVKRYGEEIIMDSSWNKSLEFKVLNYLPWLFLLIGALILFLIKSNDRSEHKNKK